MQKYLFLLVAIFLIFGCKPDDDTIDTNTEPDITEPDTTDPDTGTVNLTNTNVLLIIADDTGVEATPGYDIGTLKPQMPHLEALMADGLTFDNAWAMPLCAPTRASIITGRYGIRNGVTNVGGDNSTLSSSETSLQAFLDQQTNEAYSQAVFGKWHLSGNNANGPAELGVAHHAGPITGGVSDFYDWRITENGTTSNTQAYITSHLTDLAIDWIGQQDKPWFCWMAYTAAHTPLHLPPTGTHQQGDLPTDEASIEANPFPYFIAMMENLDYEIGRLLENIPSDELANTTIIYIGDNGTTRTVIQTPYGDNQSKGSLFQGGVHVPLIISGKDVSRKGQREASLVNSTDLFTTIAEITGIALAEYEDSHSVFPLLSSPNVGTRAYNYAEYTTSDEPTNSMGHTIRNEQYKLIKFDSGNERFYDLVADPYEKINLFNPSNGGLSTIENSALEELEAELLKIREE